MKLCKEDPTLVRPDDDELYNKLFPNAKKSRRHGMGMVVGGKTSEQIGYLLELLQESHEENQLLRGVVHTLAIKSEQLEVRMEEKWNQFLASQSQKGEQSHAANVENQQIGRAHV